MLKFKKILPIVCATAVIFAGCGSDAPAADNSAGAEPGSVVEENIDESLSAEEEVQAEEEDTQQTDGQDEEAVEEQTAAGSENSTKASGSESKAEASKSSAAETETKAAAKTETKTSSKSNTSTNTASSGSTASSSVAHAAAKPAEPTYKYKDGTYSGSAQGFNGPVGVSVTVSKDKITAVSVTSSTDDEPYISNAKALCSHMVSANSADVSGVSGATYSSNGIKGAVKAALAKAKN
ncbi:MAG: FMN-binding protein [Anaerovoracaceae bacterium]|nr:FMN-binding protein [Anaerovoracaceae bacterium]